MDYRIAACALLTMLSTVALAAPGDTTLISIDPRGGAGPKSSVDGRYVLIHWDGLWLLDRETQRSVRVDVNSSGVASNKGVYPLNPVKYDLSGNGRYVSFTSSSTNLVGGDTNGAPDVFLRDVVAGTTERVNVSSGGIQQKTDDGMPSSSVSDDGRFVAFDSVATDLVAGTGTYRVRVYYRDRLTGQTHLAGANLGWCQNPEFSGDGHSLAFECAPILTDGNFGRFHVYVLDLPSGTIEKVSVNGTGQAGNGNSFVGSLSGDGRYIAFASEASNLVEGDTNDIRDIFLRDRLNGTTERVSVSSTGEQQPYVYWSSYWSWLPATVSDDGRFVSFYSGADNFVIGDNNNQPDVFVRDRAERTTTRVNVATDGTQATYHHYADSAEVTRDGRFVFFDTAAVLTPGDTNVHNDVFMHELGATRTPPPIFTLKPRAGLDFGSQTVGSSVTKSLWLRNTGPVPVPVDRVVIRGTNAAEFKFQNLCGKSVAVGDVCAIRVTFSPTSNGPKTARLRLVSGDIVRRRDLVGLAVP